MSVVLDAGALVAIERGDKRMLAVIRREELEDRHALTHAGIIGQVWRGGAGRQAILARFVDGFDIRPIDDDLGRRAGVLLGAAGRSDVIDAALVLLAEDGDEIFTADTDDLRRLAQAAGKLVELIEV